MCRMCTEHGEGQKWFLRAENYAQDLLADITRRHYIARFAESQARQIGRRDPLDLYGLLPRVLKTPVRRIIENRLARDHYGQVVTLAEARQVVSLVSAVFRLPCMCRRITLGGEHRMCLGFSMSPDSLGAAGVVDLSYWQGPDGTGLERLSREQALELLDEFATMGLVHSVWTFGTPFIGGLCNCDQEGCRAMIGTIDHGIGIVHPGEAMAQPGQSCSGCGACAPACPFGAISAGAKGITVSAAACYGCGLCQEACPAGLMDLVPRAPGGRMMSRRRCPRC